MNLRFRPALAFLVLAATLAGCASSDSARYYSLVPPAGTASGPNAQAASVLLQAAGVRVPDALDRSEIVVLSGTQQVVPLSQDMWRSNYAQELQTAVLAAVLADGRIAQAPATGFARSVPVYALHLGLDRLDIALGQYVRMDVSWSLQALPASAGKAAVVCRASWRQELTSPQVNAAVAVQQQWVQQWGQRIQRQLLQAASVSACGAA